MAELKIGQVLPDGGTLCWPPQFCATIDAAATPLNLTMIDEANARYGYINNCWEEVGAGKAMSYMEIITDLLLTIFLGFEIYSEQQELFLQALIFHAVPRDEDRSTPKGDLMRTKSRNGRELRNTRYDFFMFYLRTWAYTLFIGFRLYFIGLVSVASAILIVSDASIAEAVLNGIALLFIIEFDNKMWLVGTWGYHSQAASDGGDFRAEYKAKLLGSWNIRPLLRVQERATVVYSILAMTLTFCIALYTRHVGVLFALDPLEVLTDRSGFSSDNVVQLWDNIVGMVSIYVIIAVLLVAYCTYRLHTRKKGTGSSRTKLHPHTSVAIIILTMAAALCATMITESLLLAFVGRGDPDVSSNAALCDTSDVALFSCSDKTMHPLTYL